ncbi:MAG: hypothetical protein V1729_03210 [Candidatus Woesearchaeota archaeon]
MTIDDDVTRILGSARYDIGKFCIEECNAYCCRKGYLVLTPGQVKLTMQGNLAEFMDKGLLKRMSDGKLSLYMGDKDHPCPSLKDNMCLIHKDPGRSDTCKMFPINIQGNKILVSKRCLAANANRLYPYIALLVKKGFVLPKE